MKPNNKEIQNDYRSIRPSVQKSLSCNKLTASNPQKTSSHKKQLTKEENPYKLEKKENSFKKNHPSISRINSVIGIITETSFQAKNIEDFLLSKTQPNEYPIKNGNISYEKTFNRDFSNEKSEFTHKREISKIFDENHNVYNEILDKMRDFKGQKGMDLENAINYMLKQYERNKKNYYEFLGEKDLLTLRFLIQTLYDKLDFPDNNNKGKIEVLEQKFLDSQRNTSILQDEMLEKNIHINTISTKFYILLQKVKDFCWLISETRKEIKNLLVNEKNLINHTRKTSLENLLKEFENVERKMQEFDANSEDKIKMQEEENNENLSFLKKLDKSKKNIKNSFKNFFEEKNNNTLKENLCYLNVNNNINNIQKNNENLNQNNRTVSDKKTLELFEKELKKSQEKVLFLIEEKNGIEKNLYDIQLINRELTNKLTDAKLRFDEKNSEIRQLKEEISKKAMEVQILQEKNKLSEENLSIGNQSKEKKEQKLQMIEKELQEIKKLTGLKENEFYMLELRNKQLENELQKMMKKFEKDEEKLEKNDNKNELEAIVEYLSLIILSKPNNSQANNEETIKNIKSICGENFFKILEEIYLKINDYEIEAINLKEKIKEQTKNKNTATQAALYFAKNLLQFFELIEKSNDEKCFRVILKEKYNNLNAMKNKYMEVISELTFAKEENSNKIVDITNNMSFLPKDPSTVKTSSASKTNKNTEKENIHRPPLNEKNNNNNNNISFSSLSLSEHSNMKKNEQNTEKQQNLNENNEIYLFMLNQASVIEQLLKNY